MNIRGEKIAEIMVGNLLTVGIIILAAACVSLKVEKQIHLNGTTTKYTLLL
jgi:hypothetical protein